MDNNNLHGLLRHQKSTDPLSVEDNVSDTYMRMAHYQVQYLPLEGTPC
jgi:hypothetical protein